MVENDVDEIDDMMESSCDESSLSENWQNMKLEVLDLPISAEDGPNTLPDISGSKVIWLLERGLPFPHWFDTFFARCNAELKVLKTDRNLVGVDPVSLGATVFILETYDPEIVDAWCVALER